MNANYHKRIATAMSDARRFIDRAQDALDAKDDWDKQPVVKRAAMKRASMDLTRSLAQVRKGEWV
jgi:hypothetical protein